MPDSADLVVQALRWMEPDRRGGDLVDHPAGEIRMGDRSWLAARAAALSGGSACQAGWSTAFCDLVGGETCTIGGSRTFAPNDGHE